MKKKGIVAVVVAAAVIGAAFTVSSCKLIKTGQTGIVYTYRDGVQKETLSPGLNFVGPMKKVKEFSTSNEILVMSKDKREGSKGDDSFKVATSDDASIAISFQMSYRYNPDTLVDTYKKFKGMDGDDIIESRVKPVLKSKISEITTNYSMMDIYSGNRSKLNSELTDYLNSEFSDKYGIEVLDASIIDVHPDKKLKEAIDNRVTALQEKQQAEAEQEKIKVQKETEKIQAETDAQIQITKGTKVLPANQTEALMRMQNIPHFKSGIGDFFGNAWAKIKDFTGDILDYVENPRKLMQIAIDKFTDLTGVLEPGLSMAKGAVSSVFDAAVNSIKGLLSDFGGSNVKYNPSAGVEQWRKLAKKALKLTGQYSESNLNRLLMQMQSESSGNPNAINNWDSNAKAGIPSKGLMQVIDPTFRSYALAPYNKNIYDPLSNMIAAIRYTVSRYGSLSRGWNGHGYANGGFPMNGEVYVANENGFGSEYIGSIGNRHVVANNNQIVESVSSGVEKANDETNALLRTVIEYQKLILKKDTSVNMDGKRMDKQISKARRNTGFSFSPT